MPRKREEAEAASTIPVPSLGTEPPAEPIALPEPGPIEEENAEIRRRRRRRKTKVEEVAPVGPVVTPESRERCKVALTLTSQLLFGLMGKRRGLHWSLSGEEAATLGEAWTAALEPYLPRVGAAVPWAAALAITWTVVQPRLAQDAENAPPSSPSMPNDTPVLVR